MFSIQQLGKHCKQYNMLSTNVNTTYNSSRQEGIHSNLSTTEVYLCWVKICTYLFALLQILIFDFLSVYETLNLSTHLQLLVTGSRYNFSFNEINDKNFVILGVQNHF